MVEWFKRWRARRELEEAIAREREEHRLAELATFGRWQLNREGGGGRLDFTGTATECQSFAAQLGYEIIYVDREHRFLFYRIPGQRRGGMTAQLTEALEHGAGMIGGGVDHGD